MQVVSARVCNAAGTVCDSVAALNSAALVTLVVRNTGAVPASYTVSFGLCSHPAQPVPAQALAIDAGETAQTVFEVWTTAAVSVAWALCASPVARLFGGGRLVN